MHMKAKYGFTHYLYSSDRQAKSLATQMRRILESVFNCVNELEQKRQLAQDPPDYVLIHLVFVKKNVDSSEERYGFLHLHQCDRRGRFYDINIENIVQDSVKCIHGIERNFQAPSDSPDYHVLIETRFTEILV